MKIFSGIFAVLVAIAIGVHGYLQISYGTISACEAAVERIKRDKKSGGFFDKAIGEVIGVGQSIVGNERLAAELELQKGTGGCYEIALLGLSE